MKYYSEILDKMFDSKRELMRAEEAAGACKKASCTAAPIDNSAAEEKKTESMTRKQLAKNVEDAEARVNEAHAALEVAKQKAAELSRKYLEETQALITPAEQEVKNAQQARFDAIREFNKAYGAYTTTYTGERAAKELEKSLADLGKFEKAFFNRFFW